jgi:hypothetical protein
MQHDLTDAVNWSIEQGIADEDNICIYGGSYGGYACLAGLTFTPDLYKCGVDIVGEIKLVNMVVFLAMTALNHLLICITFQGPSNIKTLLDSIPSYWGPLRNGMVSQHLMYAETGTYIF